MKPAMSALTIGTFALLSAQSLGNPRSCPADMPLSCQNSTVVDDTCCFNYPGGLVLLTQFWDTKPATGPVDSWTAHGFWWVFVDAV
jgi:ribonuclease T2